MKKLAFIAITLLVTNLGFAQGGKNNHAGHKNQNMSVDEQAKKETQHVSQKLSLTKDQEVQWENAARERIAASEPIKSQMNGSTTPDERKQLKDKMRANRDAFEKKTATFLNADQKAKYDQLKKEHQQKRQGGHKDHKSSPIED